MRLSQRLPVVDKQATQIYTYRQRESNVGWVCGEPNLRKRDSIWQLICTLDTAEISHGANADHNG